jgi:hypothetical protein
MVAIASLPNRLVLVMVVQNGLFTGKFNEKMLAFPALFREHSETVRYRCAAGDDRQGREVDQ